MKEVDPNAKIDSRHYLNGASLNPENVTCVRCKGCLTLSTQWEIRKHGCCRVCRGSGPYNGAYPNPLEMVRLQWHNVTKSWVMHGPTGRGWNNAKLV